MKNQYDGLLFDMDGVLVDVTNSYRRTIQKTASIYLKKEISQYEIQKVKETVGMNNDWDATYAIINDSSLSYEKVKNSFQKIYWGEGTKRGLIDNEKLLISRVQLSKLKKIYTKMGIVTGRPKEEAQYVVDRFNLRDIFDVLIGKEDTQKEKPFPDPLLKAMEILAVKKVVYIGDSPSDVAAATAAKIPCIYVGKQDIGTIKVEDMSQVVNYLL
jgi:HAD superfamily hydrolase (TIGR01548 family)